MPKFLLLLLSVWCSATNLAFAHEIDVRSCFSQADGIEDAARSATENAMHELNKLKEKHFSSQHKELAQLAAAILMVEVSVKVAVSDSLGEICLN